MTQTQYKQLLDKERTRVSQTPSIGESSSGNKQRKKFKHDTPAKHIRKSQLVSYYLGLFFIVIFVLYWLSELLITKRFAFLRFYTVLNIAAFILFGSDKILAASKNQITRVPEAFFHIIAVSGGALGIILGAQAFHHKTLKMSFMIWPVLAFVAQLMLFAYFRYWLI